jgi:GAF domain-containing protein
LQDFAGAIADSEAALESLKEQYGLNNPWYERYWDWASSAIHGDFGKDNQGQPVWPQVKRALLVTLRLVIVAERGLEDLGGLIGAGFELDDETNLNTRVVRSKRQQVFADVSRNPHFASQEHGGGRIRGWICAPMIIGDRVIGVLSIDKFEPDFYTEELAELATAFAAQAATAIENARLLETERAARQSRDARAAPSPGSTLGMSEVFDLILSEWARSSPTGGQRPRARRRRVRRRRRPAILT